jgi:DNA (cytosine-5)-methyltransferase 1
MTYPHDGKRSGGLRKGPSCSEALSDIPDAEAFERLLTEDSVATDMWGRPSEYAKALRCQTKTSWYFGYRRSWKPDILTSSLRTAHTEISRKRFLATKPGRTEPISRFFKLAPDGISSTLRAGTDSARGAFTSPRPIHYGLPRCVTVREMARLHGFPDWFRFHRTVWHGARQIGNAVPPPLARAVAGEIIKALHVKPRMPRTILNFGDVALLSMDMSAAARFWKVKAPIGRRDRKSGAKKRKQAEIEALTADGQGERA